jgi:hypothetical protein
MFMETGRISRWGMGRERILRVKRMERHYIYSYEDSINTVCKTEGKEGESNGGMNLFKVQCMHLGNYHNEITPYY